jgi:hypothetical protein
MPWQKKPEPNPNLTYHEVKVVGDGCKYPTLLIVLKVLILKRIFTASFSCVLHKHYLIITLNMPGLNDIL